MDSCFDEKVTQSIYVNSWTFGWVNMFVGQKCIKAFRSVDIYSEKRIEAMLCAMTGFIPFYVGFGNRLAI